MDELCSVAAPLLPRPHFIRRPFTAVQYSAVFHSELKRGMECQARQQMNSRSQCPLLPVQELALRESQGNVEALLRQHWAAKRMQEGSPGPSPVANLEQRLAAA